MAMEENFDLYLNPAFGGTAAYVDGAADPIYGIFDQTYVEVGIGEVAVSGRRPVLVCKDTDISGVVKNTPIVINGQNYKVIVPEPDGTGMTTLILKKL